MTAVSDESGRHVAFAKVLRDLTERMRAEAALREKEGIFRSALEVDTVGVMFFDAGGRYIRVNDTFLRMTSVAAVITAIACSAGVAVTDTST